MNLTWLHVGELVQVGEDWCERLGEKELAPYPTLRGFVSRLEERTEALKASLPRQKEETTEAEAEVKEELAGWDLVHDAGYRALDIGLEALAQRYVREEGKRKALVLAHRILLPHGRKAVTASLEEEAGEAKRLAERLKEPEVALLKEHTLDGVSFFAIAQEIVEAGEQLELWLEEKQGLKKAREAQEAKRARHNEAQARRDWLRLGNLFLAVAEEEFAAGTQEAAAARTKLLEKLGGLLEKASKRQKKAKGVKEDEQKAEAATGSNRPAP